MNLSRALLWRGVRPTLRVCGGDAWVAPMQAMMPRVLALLCLLAAAVASIAPHLTVAPTLGEYGTPLVIGSLHEQGVVREYSSIRSTRGLR